MSITTGKVSTAESQGLYYGWIIMIASLVIGIISFGIRYSFGVFFNSLEHDLSLSRTATSGIFSAYMILCSIFSVSGGWALDRFGPKKVGLIMGFLTGLSLILSSQARSALQLYFSYSLILAAGTGALFSIVNTTTSRWFLRKRGMAIGITTSAGGSGQVLMAPLCTVLVMHFDWRMSFIILGLMSWVILLPASQLLKRDPSDVGLLPDGVKPESNAIIAAKQITPEEGLSLSEAWKVREFWFLTLAWLLLSLSVHMILTHAPPHAIDLGISAIDAALIISFIGVGNIVGRLIDGRLSDRVGRKGPAIFSAILMVAALVSLLFIRELWQLCVFGLVFGYGWGGAGALLTLLIGDIFGIRRLGLIMGTITLGWNFGAATGPAVGGMVYDATGSYSGAFLTAACAMTLTAIFTILIRPEKAKGKGRVTCNVTRVP